MEHTTWLLLLLGALAIGLIFRWLWRWLSQRLQQMDEGAPVMHYHTW